MKLAQLRQAELDAGLQRIYYVNLDKNVQRRKQMEDQLRQVQPSIPYSRFAAMRGTSNGTACIPGLQDPKRCMGVSGLSRTMVKLMDTQNVTGLTLVLEDDFLLGTNLTRIQEALSMVPDDWDIVRFALAGYDNKTFLPIRNRLNLQVYRLQGPPVVCGGTHAMVWRGSSVAKLHRTWSRRPYADIDCTLSWEPGLKSYAIGRMDKPTHLFLGSLQYPAGEVSDIPKHDDPNQ